MSPLVDLDRVAAGDAAVGGKARNLARLRAGGLPCPRGFVIPASALRTMDEDALARAVAERASQLRAPFAVRSSATIEDSSSGAAPGLFRSELGVGTHDLDAAIAAVVGSARVPAVMSYCLLRGIPEDAVQMSVVIQEQVAARYAGVLYTRAPGRPDSDRIVVDLTIGPEAPWSGEVSRTGSDSPPLPPPLWQSLRATALAAEDAIDAREGADVEWVIDESEQVWLVQARPIVHPVGAAPPDAELFAFSADDPRTWTWDVTHNPDPLSPAQAGLVDRVGSAGGEVEMRVVGGYLYTAPGLEPTRSAISDPSPSALGRLFSDEILPAVDALLVPLEEDPAPALDRALAAYDEVVSLYARVVSPTLRAEKEPLRALLERTLAKSDVGPLMAALVATRSDRHLAARIRRVARGEQSIDALLAYAAPMAPAWDVAAPTFAEDPTPILGAVEIAREGRPANRLDDTQEASAHAIRLRAILDEATQHELDAALVRAREAQELGETDDHIFFRAQAVIRRSLLAVARRWNLDDPADIFYVELPWVIEHARQETSPSNTELSERVAAARSQRAQQSHTRMPLQFRRGRPLSELPQTLGRDAWRGIGCGGRAHGSVVKVRDLGSIDKDVNGRVVLARALSPSQLFRVSGAAALVSVYGGPLGHGAAMARELGIPCVVGCAGAWEELDDGEDVWIDGDSGLVARAHPR